MLYVISIPGGNTRYLKGPPGSDLDLLYNEFRAYYRLGQTMHFISDYAADAQSWTLFRDMVRENATMLIDSWKELYDAGAVATPNPENESMARLFVEYLVSHHGFRSEYPTPWAMEF